MQLPLFTFPSLVQRMGAAIQQSSTQLVDLSVGSVVRAILEANGSIGLWFQWTILRTLSTTRAATSDGTDLDTWMADFGLERLGASPASGYVTFSRFSPTAAARIPVGTELKTSAKSQIFNVIADTANLNWHAETSSYSVPAGVSAIDLPIIATNPGAAGNVTAGAINTLASPLPGIDAVTNNTALVGGADAEDDARFRRRFRDYIDSRSLATEGAIRYALHSLKPAVRCAVFDNSDSLGNAQPGHFVVVVDDGTGNPSSNLLSIAYSAVDAVRPIGTSFSVQPPTPRTVNVVIATAGSAPPPTASDIAAISASVTSLIDSMSIGETLALTKVIEAAYRPQALRRYIETVTLAGAATDLANTARGVFVAGTVTVT